MLIEATPRDQSSLSELLPEGGDASHPPVQRSVELAGSTWPGPDGVTVRYEGMHVFRGADIPPVMQFVLEFAGELSATVIAAWIISRFRDRADRVTINRREIDLDDEGQVRRIVEEEITPRAWVTDLTVAFCQRAAVRRGPRRRSSIGVPRAVSLTLVARGFSPH